MAKGSNPVDAHRKAQRKQELKKNKQKRETQREVSVVKTDTRPIEADIRRLTQEAQKGPLSKTDKDELSRLRAELARISKAKQEYVEKHPEHRKFVFPERGPDPAQRVASDEPAGLYDRNGRLKHPERSLYYDPVFNPFGAPPPGMPYREKPEFALQRLAEAGLRLVPTPEEVASFQPVGLETESSDDDDDGEGEDDEIMMPEGPPPPPSEPAPLVVEGDNDSSDDSDDSMDIPLPPGPPPPRPGNEPAKTTSRISISRPTRPAASPFFPPHARPLQPPHGLPARPSFQPPPPPHVPHSRNPPPPVQHSRLPPRPPPGVAHMSDPLNSGGGPQRAFQQGRPGAPLGPVQPETTTEGGVSEQPGAGSSAVSSAGPSPFLSVGVGSGTGGGAGATISAAPVLRDLKKEATAFVPTAMRRKMAAQKATLARAGLTSVDAARGTGASGQDDIGALAANGESKKKSLVEEMRERGIGVGGTADAKRTDTDQGKEDYERFRTEMGDFL